MNLPFRKSPAAVTTPGDFDLDVRVAAANPLPQERLALLALPELMAFRQQITATSNPRSTPLRRQRRWHASRLLLLSGLVVLAAGGGLYAAAWGAHTGWFGAPGSTESDTSEWLREDAPDIVAVVDGLTAKYQLPPGGTWGGLRNTYPKAAGSGYIQVTGLESEVSIDAYCQWQHYWIEGNQTHDAAKMAAAQVVLDEFPDWPISRKTGDPSAIAQWQLIAKLARTNQSDQLEHLYSLNCSGPGTQP
jgi:hypothetical protein